MIETRFKIMEINSSQDSAVTLSDTFSKLALLQEREAIKDFALTRTTMGEVFTDFAKFQIDAHCQGDEKPKNN